MKSRLDPLGRAASALGLERRGGIARGRVCGRWIEIETPVNAPPGASTPVLLTGRIEPALDLGLRVSAPRPGMPSARAGIRLRTGRAPLDERLVVVADEEERAHALLEPLADELDACFAESGAADVVLTDGSVRWAGQGAHAAALVSAARALGALLVAIDERRRSVPVATDLRSHVEVWREIAARRGHGCSETPLCLWGRTDGVDVRAQAVRVSRCRHRVDVVARFVEPLRVALLVRPRGLLDGGGLTLDPALDDAFVTGATDRCALGKLLDPDARRSLLDLRDLGPEIADDAVRLRTRILPHPARVTAILSAALSLAVRLRDNARALRAPRAGPYR